MRTPQQTEAYRRQIQAVRDKLEAYVRSRFTAGEYRDADLERFVREVVPVVLAGRRQVSALTDAYFAKTLGIPPKGPLDTDLLRGVPAEQVYARPFVTVRTKLAEGKTLEQAVSAGLARVSDLVLSDLQMAKRDTSQRSMRSAGVTRWVRVLVGNVNCALCYVASTQTYSTSDLMAIHPGCNCEVEPLTSDWDPGDQLSATHEAVENRLGVSDTGARAPDYRKQLIVREHGELGPVLTVKGQHFSGKSVMDV